jgi:ATP-binding cassette, subfamily B, bacterial
LYVIGATEQRFASSLFLSTTGNLSFNLLLVTKLLPYPTLSRSPTPSPSNSEPLVTRKSEFVVQGAYPYNRLSVPRWIVSHLWRYRGFLLTALTLFLASHLAYSMAPVLIGRAAEEILHPTAPDALRTIALGILGVLVFDGFAMLLGSYAVEVIAKRFEADAREELYANLLGKSQTFHDRQRVGDLMARATDDVSNLSSMTMPGLSLITETGLAIVVPLSYIASISPEMLLVPLAFIFT